MVAGLLVIAQWLVRKKHGPSTNSCVKRPMRSVSQSLHTLLLLLILLLLLLPLPLFFHTSGEDGASIIGDALPAMRVIEHLALQQGTDRECHMCEKIVTANVTCVRPSDVGFCHDTVCPAPVDKRKSLARR